MKKFFSFLLLLISAVWCHAQEGKGAINITAFPEGVTITFLGDEYKNSVERESISAGNYKVILTKIGYVPVDTMLEVKAGITKYYNIVLNQKKTEVVSNDVKGIKAKKNSTVPSAKKWNVYGMFQLMLTSGMSQGGMLGATYKGSGFYVKGVKSFINKPELKAHGESITDDKLYTFAEALAGYMHEFNTHLTGYVGTGYGKRRVWNKWSDGDYSYNKKDYVDGAAFDLGAICRINNFAVSLGANTINFKTFAFTAGIGVSF